MTAPLRIACGQGFWGDRLDAPIEQVRRGPIDVLMLDYLAEVTMSILQKQRSRDPTQGYARDFVPLLQEIFPDIAEKRIRVISNAGGVNVEACRDGLVDAARRAGVAGRVRIGTALARNHGLQLGPSAAGLLTTGRVDPRLMIVLTVLASSHTLVISDFPTAPY